VVNIQSSILFSHKEKKKDVILKIITNHCHKDKNSMLYVEFGGEEKGDESKMGCGGGNKFGGIRRG
jgi:hypothetical protein